MARPALRKPVVDYVCGHHPISERRAFRPPPSTDAEHEAVHRLP